MISNYPFSNGGYLISFSQVEPDGSSKSYDPAYSLDFEASKLSTYLDTSSIFLPVDERVIGKYGSLRRTFL